MTDFSLIQQLIQPAQTKIVLLVMDGLGGLPRPEDDKTELEAAHTPNMDRLAREGCLGQHYPVAPGITSGSGPGHLALFGFDPLRYEIGRGVLEAVGIGFQVTERDVCARGNFCTLDAEGRIVDRRAGRIPTEMCARLVKKINDANLRVTDDVEVFVEPVQDYRFVVVMRGDGLHDAIDETDPQRTGVPPLPARARLPEAERTAALFNRWIELATAVIRDEHPANGLTLRGFAKEPGLPKFKDVYGLRAAAIATYPMYRGVASLVGMERIEHHAHTVREEFEVAARIWNDYDFFFIHVKYTDSRGEDGDFAAKQAVIEEVDAALPALLALKPDVLIITGDHSTPSQLRSHSWHPVPLLLWAPATARRDGSTHFGERACARGGLGTFLARDIMPLALAHAQRLQKFGA
ncbi:MAG: 2,3-bisphosphoglycerate-independent phosphoglycerate mutase [Thermoflexales bacterium]|nr:2,3-bisphosphoglycerate-independent phosphoglycerate mutase [Thermoflexales bacterium]MCS7324730.1 2,3-bisphosphoglycerate-independent phosphoglycerate mutase [Thermoflexales bacterium]MCX7939061.1 2,3-bisphosphoglycerate-independent phosphoglycerate mutase [Thermoflexales bacterium]MDW8053054.1 2,3-bisphosphoglycerate-independent phosphoglycerate mutase [Anaerolineae bacterium]MDW8291707.1 2,3-bisphosphoglycerate-independent phosphoglycerate mutase [Anaerolineae bacterium]